MKLFADRREAGRVLAQRLQEYAGRSDVIVLGLPRGGVPVAYEVAKALGAPLDVFIARKLGVPWNPEFGFGALASGGMVYVDTETASQVGVTREDLALAIEAESRELARREHLYCGDRPFPDLHNRTVILVDDGLATGSTMRAAVLAVRTKHPREIIVAAPVASRQACETLAHIADRTLCAAEPDVFYGVGMWYENFDQTTDDEVLALLNETSQPTESVQR